MFKLRDREGDKRKQLDLAIINETIKVVTAYKM